MLSWYTYKVTRLSEKQNHLQPNRGLQKCRVQLHGQNRRGHLEMKSNYLIGHDEELLFKGEMKDVFDAFPALNLTWGWRGGSRVISSQQKVTSPIKLANRNHKV